MPPSDFPLGLLWPVAAAVDSGGTVVLVSQDGIQRPPFRFPKGGHLLQFLSCLENGLLPHGQLDPPLWSQRGKVSVSGRDWAGGGRGTGSCVASEPLCCFWDPAHLGKPPPQHFLPGWVGHMVGACSEFHAPECVLSGQSVPQAAQAKPSELS